MSRLKIILGVVLIIFGGFSAFIVLPATCIGFDNSYCILDSIKFLPILVVASGIIVLVKGFLGKRKVNIS